MAKRVVIQGLTVREAQIALLDAVNEKAIDKLSVWNDGETRIIFNDFGIYIMFNQDGDDIIMLDAGEYNETAWRVTEGILRLAAAAKRNASK